MRTEHEIKRAIQHLTDALAYRPADADSFTVAGTLSTIDVLNWMLGNESKFAELITQCDEVDQRRRQ